MNLKEIQNILGERPFGMPETMREVLNATSEINKNETKED